MAFSGIPLPRMEDIGAVNSLRELSDLRKQQLANQYYGPNIESEMANRNALTQQYNINNQSLPEKNRLANAFQALQNQWYVPNIQSEIGLRNAQRGKTSAETQYMPLDYAIRAQNALTSTNRFGNLGMYLRTIHEMPVAERTQYLADPANRAQFDAIQNEFLRSSNQQNQNSLLNDKFLKQFGMEGGIPNQLNNVSGNNVNSGMSFDKNGNNIVATPQEIDNAVNRLENANTTQQNMPQEEKSYVPNSVDFSQMNANNKLLTAAIKNRRDNAVAMEKWLAKNREPYSRAFDAASKYAGIIGKGKRGLDAVKATDPKAYEDLQWLNTSFIPHLSNQVKLMEKMGATDSQREELHGLAGALNQWQLDPEHALSLMNRQIGTIQDISGSVFDAAEPMYKGITRKMYNMPEIKGDYILPSKGKKGNFEETKTIKGVKYKKVNGEWHYA